MGTLAEQAVGSIVELRRWTVDDAEVLAALIGRNLDHLRGRMPWIAEEPQTPEQRRSLITTWEEAWREGRECHYGIYLGAVSVGSCGLRPRIGPGGLEMGYWVDVDHQGRGIATDAAGLLTELAFTTSEVVRIEIHHDASNLASGRVPEKLGYRFVGEVASSKDQAPDDTGRDRIWRITREQWAARA